MLDTFISYYLNTKREVDDAIVSQIDILQCLVVVEDVRQTFQTFIGQIQFRKVVPGVVETQLEVG
jgi:hypothetical protein